MVVLGGEDGGSCGDGNGDDGDVVVDDDVRDYNGRWWEEREGTFGG